MQAIRRIMNRPGSVNRLVSVRKSANEKSNIDEPKNAGRQTNNVAMKKSKGERENVAKKHAAKRNEKGLNEKLKLDGVLSKSENGESKKSQPGDAVSSKLVNRLSVNEESGATAGIDTSAIGRTCPASTLLRLMKTSETVCPGR